MEWDLENKVIELLEKTGFKKLEARVYVYLAKNGIQKASTIAKSLGVQKQTLYPILKELEKKGVVSVAIEHPARFSAIPFEKVLDLFINLKVEETKLLRKKRDKILSDWNTISTEKTQPSIEKFMVIEGRKYILSKVQQMISETTDQFSLMTTVKSLIRADQFGLIDRAIKDSSRRNITFRFLTELNSKNKQHIKSIIKRGKENQANFNFRTPDLGLKLTNHVYIKDFEEALFFMHHTDDLDETEPHMTCLWTNSKPLVEAFIALFEEIWQKSTDISKRIHEIETGKPSTKTCIITNPEIAENNYNEKIINAKQEIMLLTSSLGLISFFEKGLSCLTKNDVSIKVMAPITKENLSAVKKMSKVCGIRHVPNNYLPITIIDGQYLFQFKNPSLRNQKKRDISFENTFYTDDFEYVEKAKKLLDDVWNNSRSPSIVTLEEISQPRIRPVAPISDGKLVMSKKNSPYTKMVVGIDEKRNIVTADYVLKKIIKARRIPAKDPLKDIVRLYGSMASAVIHQPNNLELPDMILVFYHCNKQSSFGAEDWLQVYLFLETSKGQTFVPVAIVGDNADSVQWRKINYYAGTPASQNCQLLKKDQLQIKVHGNTLFAGWTVPIKLYQKYILPPSGILFEGYSNLKTVVSKTVMPSGVKVVIEGNGFDSFVTLFNSQSKYLGPGTDGTIGRDMILTTYPPSN